MKSSICVYLSLLSIIFMGLLNACSFDADDSEVCFIGDSITYFWDLEEYFPTYNIHKHAVGGATLHSLSKWDVSDCMGVKTFLLIGTNDVGELTSQSSDFEERQNRFVDSYVEQVKRIGASPLIAISILPRKSEGQDSTVNIALKRQNYKILKALDSVGMNHVFLDVFDLFLSEGFNLNEIYFKDGVHPVFEGYEILASEVRRKL